MWCVQEAWHGLAVIYEMKVTIKVAEVRKNLGLALNLLTSHFGGNSFFIFSRKRERAKDDMFSACSRVLAN
jgi:hypothetical protein